MKTLGQIAYEAFREFYKGNNNGIEIYEWEFLKEREKLAWEYCVEAVLVEKIATGS